MLVSWPFERYFHLTVHELPALLLSLTNMTEWIIWNDEPGEQCGSPGLLPRPPRGWSAPWGGRHWVVVQVRAWGKLSWNISFNLCACSTWPVSPPSGGNLEGGAGTQVFTSLALSISIRGGIKNKHRHRRNVSFHFYDKFNLWQDYFITRKLLSKDNYYH